ncbi:MAG TPA: TIGR01777 family oxidoreductase [Anaerolineales bacterium]|nr:TIGR01777 family oxidoreductase [Anaerolineales bacterium]
MKVLIAGGSGFLGKALTNSLKEDNHDVIILTRRAPKFVDQIQWDGKTTKGWAYIVNEVDAVIHLAGFGLQHWPWTRKQKQKFIDSRVNPGLALVSAIQNASRRPRVFLQSSGVNRYGLQGVGVADESTPPGDDFLSQMTIPWEAVSEPIERLGVRCIVTRNAVVLAKRDGLFPLMALPVRIFFGGRFGNGKQAVPWIHITDHTRAVRFLLDHENAQGPYNLISPTPTSNADFMKAVAKALHRPYWFHIPEFLLKLVLGEMSILLTRGRYSQPKRLIELGFQFQFGELENAMEDLLVRTKTGQSGR